MQKVLSRRPTRTVDGASAIPYDVGQDYAPLSRGIPPSRGLSLSITGRTSQEDHRRQLHPGQQLYCLRGLTTQLLVESDFPSYGSDLAAEDVEDLGLVRGIVGPSSNRDILPVPLCPERRVTDRPSTPMPMNDRRRKPERCQARGGGVTVVRVPRRGEWGSAGMPNGNDLERDRSELTAGP